MSIPSIPPLSGLQGAANYVVGAARECLTALQEDCKGHAPAQLPENRQNDPTAGELGDRLSNEMGLCADAVKNVENTKTVMALYNAAIKVHTITNDFVAHLAILYANDKSNGRYIKVKKAVHTQWLANKALLDAAVAAAQADVLTGELHCP